MARTGRDRLASCALALTSAGLVLAALANVVLYHGFQFFWLVGVAHLGLADLLPGWHVTASPVGVSMIDVAVWSVSLLVGLIAIGLGRWACRLGRGRQLF